MSILLIIFLLPTVFSDNRTTSIIELSLDSPTYDIGESIAMQSSGFIDISLLEFISLDEDTTIDIAIFPEPQDGSSYHTIGLGNLKGEMCCSSLREDAGDCKEAGRLNVHDSYKYVYMHVFVPAMANVTISPYNFDPMVFIEDTGRYSLLFANCNELKTRAVILGRVISDSFVTDEEIEKSVPFYAVLTTAYGALLIWFGYLMYENRQSRVRFEEYILALIVLGVLETLLMTIDFAKENEDLRALSIATIFIGTLKHGLARCVMMMVSLGWGVTVPSLNFITMAVILVLGGSYALLTFIMEMAEISQGAGVEEADVDDDITNYSAPVQVAGLFLSIINFTIWLWVLFCLNVTIKYLEDNQQERKLKRYKWLLNIVIFAVIMNIMALVIISMQIGSGQPVNLTIWPEAMETGFFLVVACVAILWRPNPNAREYAYVEELSTENDTYELELTEDSSNVMEDGSEDSHGDSRTNREIT